VLKIRPFSVSINAILSTSFIIRSGFRYCNIPLLANV
jgi:hypothetical protein